jgi:hypothetical protein
MTKVNACKYGNLIMKHLILYNLKKKIERRKLSSQAAYEAFVHMQNKPFSLWMGLSNYSKNKLTMVKCLF